jgi:hypothetical protein
MSDDAYGRVTDPERYRPLHDETGELLDRLDRGYDVERTGGAAVDPELANKRPITDLVRLTPRAAGAAPLTVAFTDFPGVLARFGLWRVEAFPHCGCDACDEDPRRLMDTLARQIEILVAGGFSEEVEAGGWAVKFEFHGAHRGRRVLRPEEAARVGGPRRVAWASWRRG